MDKHVLPIKPDFCDDILFLSDKLVNEHNSRRDILNSNHKKNKRASQYIVGESYETKSRIRFNTWFDI